MENNKKTRQEAKGKARAGTTQPWVKVVGWVVAIAFLLVLAVSVLHTTGLLQRSLTTVKVGDMTVSALDYNIYYMYTRNSWLNSTDSTYGMPMYYMLQMYGYPVDNTLDAMDNDEGTGTWRDSFNDMTVENIHSVLSLCQEGKAAGHVTSDEYANMGQEQLDEFAAYADEYGTTLKGYITSYYGNNTSEKDVLRVYENLAFAGSYSSALQGDYGIGDSEIEAYYQENKDTYDRADYYSYSFPYTTYTYTEPAEGEDIAEGQPTSEAEAETMTQASMDESKQVAESFLNRIKGGEDFDTVAEEYFQIEEATHTHGEGEEEHTFSSSLYVGGSLTGTDAIGQWLKEDRASGDTDMLDTGNAHVVVRFESRYRTPTRTATARHILFSISTELSEEPTEEEQAIYDLEREMAYTSARTVLTTWETGEATEESFAQLARENSSDGNAEQGGIYEHFSEGSMVETFNDWVFDESRQPGDTGIVETDYGIHVMYFVSFDKDAYYYSIESTLINDRFTADLEAIMAKYEPKVTNMGLKLSF